MRHTIKCNDCWNRGCPDYGSGRVISAPVECTAQVWGGDVFDDEYNGDEVTYIHVTPGVHVTSAPKRIRKPNARRKTARTKR